MGRQQKNKRREATSVQLCRAQNRDLPSSLTKHSYNRTAPQHWTTGPTGSPGITRSCNNHTDHNKDKKAQKRAEVRVSHPDPPGFLKRRVTGVHLKYSQTNQDPLKQRRKEIETLILTQKVKHGGETKAPMTRLRAAQVLLFLILV